MDRPPPASATPWRSPGFPCHPRHSSESEAAVSPVGDQPRGREAQRSGLDSLACKLAHHGEIFELSPARGRRRAVPSRRPVAANAAKNRRRRCHAARVERVEKLREGLPVPGKPSAITTPGMSSTPAMTSTRRRDLSGRHGANPTPQLPITAVVTPCADDGLSRSDQIAWPS